MLFLPGLIQLQPKSFGLKAISQTILFNEFPRESLAFLLSDLTGLELWQKGNVEALFLQVAKSLL